MKILRVIYLIITSVMAVTGGIMAFAGEFISYLPKNAIPWSTDKAQLIGLALFMVAVILHMIASQIEGIKSETIKPRLFLRDTLTEFKHAYKPVNGQRKLIGEWYFACVNIANEPDDWDNGQAAEKATAEIIFETPDGKKTRIEYARWWDKDIPLFPASWDVKSLKQIDINPGHPETLVLAFRKKKGKDIYAFYYTDHSNIENLYAKRKIGKPPVKVLIKLRGRFKPKEFSCLLNLDDSGNFAVEEHGKMKKN